MLADEDVALAGALGAVASGRSWPAVALAGFGVTLVARAARGVAAARLTAAARLARVPVMPVRAALAT